MASEREIRMKSLSLCSNVTASSKIPVWRNVALHDRCSQQDMVKMREAFQQASGKTMTAAEFRDLLKTLLNLEYDDDEFKIMFLKVSHVVNLRWIRRL